MSTFRPSPEEGTTTVNIPLFLATVPRASRFHEIFKVTNLCHIAIRVDAYKAQTGVIHCYNCQQFGHVWANCKQPLLCVRCGGGHLHKECPEKGNTASIPTCYNCKLVEREESHPSNYRGCRHVEEEMWKRKSQRAPQTATGRAFSSNHTTPGLSIAAMLCSNTSAAAASATLSCKALSPPLRHNQQQVLSQLVQAHNANSSSLNDMFKVAAAVFQQIMT
jgi:hypothetical protein